MERKRQSILNGINPVIEASINCIRHTIPFVTKGKNFKLLPLPIFSNHIFSIYWATLTVTFVTINKENGSKFINCHITFFDDFVQRSFETIGVMENYKSFATDIRFHCKRTFLRFHILIFIIIK